MWMLEIAQRLKKHPIKEIPVGNRIPSSVLVPLSVERGMLHITFIQRTHQISHGGQIGFPGGHVEGEDPTLLATALREVEEELGIPPHKVIPLGRLGDQVTPTGYWIRPFVGAFPTGVAYMKDTREVAQVLTLPIPVLLRSQKGNRFIVGKEVIWGVTARILKECLSLIQ